MCIFLKQVHFHPKQGELSCILGREIEVLHVPLELVNIAERHVAANHLVFALLPAQSEGHVLTWLDRTGQLEYMYDISII